VCGEDGGSWAWKRDHSVKKFCESDTPTVTQKTDKPRFFEQKLENKPWCVIK
jgi:hypothetical protein